METCAECEGWCRGLVASRRLVDSDKHSIVYVSALPEKSGADWGYNASPKKALTLTHAQASRFARDMEHARASYSIVGQFEGDQ